MLICGPREVQVQMVGDVGDCIFTHHRVVHSAGSNIGGTIRSPPNQQLSLKNIAVDPPHPTSCWSLKHSC